MACIIKAPPHKGVVSFTTVERDRVILKDKNLQTKIKALKDKWIIGLHHNWHDTNFVRQALFDFSMAGAGDLRGQSTPTIQLDACNFAPECFKISDGEKFWDVLYVARNVGFKRLPVFFDQMKKLLSVKKCRILLISPTEQKTAAAFCDSYDKKFNRDEKELFSLIAPMHYYPFPYSIETIAFYYRHSKIFAHFADEERRCRVCGYAWACGMPVVSMDHPASILPSELRKPPFLYRVGNNDNYVPQIVRALDEYQGWLEEPTKFFSIRHTKVRFKDALVKMFGVDTNNLNFEDFDIRLGRHHQLATGSNKIPMDLHTFVDNLRTKDLSKYISEPDPEMALCR